MSFYLIFQIFFFPLINNYQTCKIYSLTEDNFTDLNLEDLLLV